MLYFVQTREDMYRVAEAGLRGWPVFEAAVWAGHESIADIINPYLRRYKPEVVYVYSERGFLWFKGHAKDRLF